MRSSDKHAQYFSNDLPPPKVKSTVTQFVLLLRPMFYLKLKKTSHTTKLLCDDYIDASTRNNELVQPKYKPNSENKNTPEKHKGI